MRMRGWRWLRELRGWVLGSWRGATFGVVPEPCDGSGCAFCGVARGAVCGCRFVRGAVCKGAWVGFEKGTDVSITGALEAAAAVFPYGLGVCAKTAQPPTNALTLPAAINQRHAGVKGREYLFAISGNYTAST